MIPAARAWEPRFGRRPSPFRVVALALVVTVIQVLFTTLAARRNGEAPLAVGAYALLVASGAALLARRSHPSATLMLTLAATLAYWLAGYPHGPIFLALLVAFFNAAICGRRAAVWASLLLGYAGFLGLGAATGAAHFSLGHALVLAAWLLALGAGVELLRSRGERRAAAWRARRQESLRRVGEERLRIARELHDVLAHNVSLINVQAGVALHLLDREPERAEPALAAIKQASAETLREMRSVLGTLRQVDERAPRAPAPSLDRLDELLGRMRAAGLEVRLTVAGKRRALSPAVELAAYRIVQEALTNVARHAGGAAAAVELRYGDRELEIEVSDGGAAAADPLAEGNGIVGMRERCLALGGELSAGPAADGGFTVRARLPLEAEP